MGVISYKIVKKGKKKYVEVNGPFLKPKSGYSPKKEDTISNENWQMRPDVAKHVAEFYGRGISGIKYVLTSPSGTRKKFTEADYRGLRELEVNSFNEYMGKKETSRKEKRILKRYLKQSSKKKSGSGGGLKEAASESLLERFITGIIDLLT